MISGIIKVEASVISRGRGPRPITLAETLIILDITKNEFNYCLIIHCFMENMQRLLREMQVDFICACKKYKYKHTKRSHRSKPIKCSNSQNKQGAPGQSEC